MTLFENTPCRFPPLAGWIGGLCLLLSLSALAPSVCQAQEQAKILVKSNVAEANVVVDGAVVGETEEDGTVLIGDLTPGERTVELRKSGYWNASQRVTLESGLTKPLSLSLSPRSGGNVGKLIVQTNVEGAAVSLDGQERGETGPEGRFVISGVGPGQHRVVIEKEGYQAASRTVVYEEGQSGLAQTVPFQLVELGAERPPVAGLEPDQTVEAESADEDGVPDSIDTTFPTEDDGAGNEPALFVDAGVADATVQVDDSVYGRTEADGWFRVPVDSGKHQVTVSKEGFSTAQKTARLAAGEERALSLNLQPTYLGQTDTGGVLLFILVLTGGVGLVAAFVVLINRPRGTFGYQVREWMGVSQRTSYKLASWVLHPFQDRRPFDKYYLIRELRSGEFATVHLADDPEASRQVRLRVLDNPYATDSEHAQSFLEGGRILQDLRESAPEAPIVTVYRYGREDWKDDGRPFIAMEYFQGKTLITYMKENKTLSVKEALLIIRQVCIALRAAHEKDICHGHLTPANIILTQEASRPTIKLTGFGERGHRYTTAILTDGHPGSTTSYLAPEKFEHGRGTPQSDMYAVGMLFYKMVTGEPPFVHENPVRIVEMQKEMDPPDLPGHVPATLRPLFYRMVSKDANKRPTAKNVISTLDLIEVVA